MDITISYLGLCEGVWEDFKNRIAFGGYSGGKMRGKTPFLDTVQG